MGRFAEWDQTQHLEQERTWVTWYFIHGDNQTGGAQGAPRQALKLS